MVIMSREDQIAEFEAEVSKTKYNKRTQHHVGLVKAKIAKLKREVEVESKKGGKHVGYSVKRTGDATVSLVGYPSVGKSTLLNSITNAESEVGAYDFTTLEVIPGVLMYNGARIQLLDIPGLIVGAAKGAGRGKEIFSVVKGTDLVIILFDPRTVSKAKGLLEEIYESNIRLNTIPPDVVVKKRGLGGIDLGVTVKLTKIDEETIKAMMREMGFSNASIVIRTDISADQLLDALTANRVYMPGILIINKIDTISESKRKAIEKDINPDLFISSDKGINIEEVRDLIFNKLNLLRIYMKEPRKEPDMDEPMIMHVGDTIQTVANKVHKDVMKYFRYAKVWGSSKFPGQKLGMTYKLKDKDIVQLVLD